MNIYYILLLLLLALGCDKNNKKKNDILSISSYDTHLIYNIIIY